MPKEPSPTPPASSAGDTAHALVKGALSSVPIGGGLIAEVFGLLVRPPLQRRLTRFLQEVAEDLAELKDKGRVDFATLPGNEGFVSAVGHAADIVLRTHQEEKLRALRNAVLNSAISSTLEADTQSMFLNFVDYFTAWHLRLLAFLQDPPAWENRMGVALPRGTIVSNIPSTLEAAFPDLRGRGDFCRQLVRDLYERGLTTLDARALGTNVSPDAPFQPRTTSLGTQFLDFIAGPP